MPHILVRNISESDIKNVWTDIKQEMCKLCDCSEDWFTVEIIQTKAITEVPVFVQINWFERVGMKQDIVNLITDKINELGHEDVTIIFKDLPEKVYFENKKAF